MGKTRGYTAGKRRQKKEKGTKKNKTIVRTQYKITEIVHTSTTMKIVHDLPLPKCNSVKLLLSFMSVQMDTHHSSLAFGPHWF